MSKRYIVHLDYFELRDGELYYKGKSMPLTIRGEKLRSVGVMAEKLGKEGLRNLGFIILRGKTTAQQVVMLKKLKKSCLLHLM